MRTPEGMIAYQVVGEGPIDLVYLSGSTSHIDMRWELPAFTRFLERLAGFSRLILFDRRGTGASDPIPFDRTPTWEEWAEDLRAVLDEVGSQRTALFATLDGGPMAIVFSAMHPDRVRALILANSGARVLAADDYPAGMTEENFAALIAALEKGWGTEALAAALSPTVAGDPETRAWFARYMRASATPRALVAQQRAMATLDVRAALPLITVPTLVLHRRGLQVVPIELGRYVAGSIPGATFVELEGSDSLLLGPDGDATLDTIEEFLTGMPPQAQVDRVLATVLFTDLVDSTRRAAEVGDRRWREIIDRHDEITRRSIEGARGRLIKTTGDGVLAAFDSPGRAIRCTLSLRRALADIGLQVRSGLHVGEVERRGDDIGGIAVNIAARVMDEAAPGEILVSGAVPALVAGSNFTFEERGARELRGVPGSWQLFAVGDEVDPRSSS